MLQSTGTVTTKTAYHICSLIFLPPNSTVLILKSIPAIHKTDNTCSFHAAVSCDVIT